MYGERGEPRDSFRVLLSRDFSRLPPNGELAPTGMLFNNYSSSPNADSESIAHLFSLLVGYNI